MKKRGFRKTIAALLIFTAIIMSLFSCAGDELPAVVTKGLPEEDSSGTITANGFVYTLYKTYAELTAYKGSETVPVIPDQIELKPVMSIGASAFQGNKNITEVKLPALLRQIKKHAFDGCENLTVINLPGTLESIGDYAFKECGFSSIDLPESLVSIGKYCFYESKLEHIDIPSGISRAGKYAFYGCHYLKSFTLPPRMTEISDKMFYNCTSLEEVTLPDTVTKICDYAFSGCSSLKTLTISNSVTSIGNGIIVGCPSAVIIAKEGSFAAKYAQNNNYSLETTK